MFMNHQLPQWSLALSDSTLTVDVSPENERRLKTESGVFIGTVAGLKDERNTLAESLSMLFHLLESNVGRKGRFATLRLHVEIKDGQVAICECGESRTLKPLRKI